MNWGQEVGFFRKNQKVGSGGEYDEKHNCADTGFYLILAADSTVS